MKQSYDPFLDKYYTELPKYSDEEEEILRREKLLPYGRTFYVRRPYYEAFAEDEDICCGGEDDVRYHKIVRPLLKREDLYKLSPPRRVEKEVEFRRPPPKEIEENKEVLYQREREREQPVRPVYREENGAPDNDLLYGVDALPSCPLKKTKRDLFYYNLEKNNPERYTKRLRSSSFRKHPYYYSKHANKNKNYIMATCDSTVFCYRKLEQLLKCGKCPYPAPYPKCIECNGIFQLTEEERLGVLFYLKEIRDFIAEQLRRFPCDYHLRSYGIRERRRILEKRMEEIEFAIKIFSLTDVKLRM